MRSLNLEDRIVGFAFHSGVYCRSLYRVSKGSYRGSSFQGILFMDLVGFTNIGYSRHLGFVLDPYKSSRTRRRQ